MTKPCFWKVAAASAVFCLGFLGATAHAAPLWFQFYGTGEGSSERVENGEQSFTVGGVTVTVSSHRPGTTPSPASSQTLIRNTVPFAGFGVGPRQRDPTLSAARSALEDAVGSGDSLFLSFDREVTLTATVSFDTAGGYTLFNGRRAGHFYEVWRLSGGSSVLVGSVDPVARPLEGAKRPPGTAPFGDDVNAQVVQRNGQAGPPLLVPVAALGRGQTLRGRQFELRTPAPEDRTEFYWWLGGIAIEVQSTAPIPEPSTALLTAAGLFALGFAGARRRRPAA